MKKLLFEDLSTGNRWEHACNDWVLMYCNFNTPTHPSLLKVGLL